MSFSRLSFTLPFSVALLAPLTGCQLGERGLTGECPRGEVCSDATPGGLNFNGASLSDALLDFGPHPTLVGGTQAVRLEDGDTLRALDLPYVADDEGGAGVKVEGTSGAVVTLRGVNAASNYLRITDLDGELYDRKQLRAVSLSEIRILPGRVEQIAEGESVVFAAGTQDIVVGLVALADGDEVRAIDESMKLALDGATRSRWDTLHLDAAAVGRHPLTVTAGGQPGVLDVEVVAGPDAIAAQELQSPLAFNQTSMICFSAHAAGRHVAGLSWTFATDNGTAEQSLVPNCAVVKPARTGGATITARAGGKTLAATFPVSAGQVRCGGGGLPAVIHGPAGERAAAVEARRASAQ